MLGGCALDHKDKSNLSKGFLHRSRRRFEPVNRANNDSQHPAGGENRPQKGGGTKECADPLENKSMKILLGKEQRQQGDQGPASI